MRGGPRVDGGCPIHNTTGIEFGRFCLVPNFYHIKGRVTNFSTSSATNPHRDLSNHGYHFHGDLRWKQYPIQRGLESSAANAQ